MNTLRPFISALMVSVALSAAASANAASFKVLHTFQATFGTNDGKNSGGLIQSSQGLYYGMTTDGGPKFYGEVYSMTKAGVVKVLYAFDSTAGNPQGELVDGKDGFFYGVVRNTTGTNGSSGAVFKITPTGVLTYIHTFTSAEGAYPTPIITAPDGMLYGSLTSGGHWGDGTFYQMTRAGVFNPLTPFDASSSGAPIGKPTTTGDGNFYVASYGVWSPQWCQCTQVVGGITRVTLPGTSLMISQEKSNGALLAAVDGNLYGTDTTGGANGKGSVFRMDRNGNGLTVLYSFTGGADGGAPAPALAYSNGFFYGTTTTGGPSNGGTLFKLSPGGQFALMHTFDPNSGLGGVATAPLMVNAQGKLIGAMQASGANGGSVFQQAP